MSDMTGQRIGFVGLGSMGGPMAVNLARAGFAVVGYDRRAEAAAPLVAEGGRATASAAEAAAGADALVLMVVNAAQAETVLFADGALEALPAGASVILMATCPPGAAAALAARVEAAGRRFVDAPVSGGVAGAKAGTLTIMAAAPADLFAQNRALLLAMGSRLRHVGETAGQGATVKAINQLLCGVHLAAAGEALALAKSVGVDPAVVLDIMSGSAAMSWMLTDRGPRMIRDNPEVTSAVDIFVKDLGIVLAAGQDAGAATPLAATAHRLFVASSEAGHGLEDDSQVVHVFPTLKA
ncbi:NAD(P)-dependent oxidoreductase [Hyphomicrobiaceae bacterium 22]|uniref:NAD(P)-dependent oxidoreductase n=2 Tax=Prosthecodimorpha staleyi TaxID=2840188 RepID=A0A947GFH6_9HYPH|nr:NAD(P)-dependent oxidoreductase [Prosthecodimorpha staleyi]MBT9293222.1 NAD(P)-dependent oxidoreductase [Prosthecodimorpha staleyi]